MAGVSPAALTAGTAQGYSITTGQSLILAKILARVACMTTVPLAEAKNRLSEYVSDVERTHDRVTITRHGRTAAVLVSADEPLGVGGNSRRLDHARRAGGDRGGSGRPGSRPGRRQRGTASPLPLWVSRRRDVRISARAERDLARLPAKVGAACLEFIFGPLADDPYRLGGVLRGQLTGLRSARRGSYRIIYGVDEEQGLGRV